MTSYLESIKNIEAPGTGAQMDGFSDPLVVIDSSGEAPDVTSVDGEVPSIDFNKDLVSYSAPKKVSVRKYRLRK